MLATLRLLLLAFLVIALPAYAGEKEDKTVEAMQASDGYRYTIVAGAESVAVQTISGEQYGQVLERDPGIRKAGKGWEASPHIAHRIAPFIVGKGFTAEKLQTPFIDIALDKNTTRLYARSAADAVYAFRLLAPAGLFKGWLDANAPLLPEMEPLENDLHGKTKETKEGGMLAAAKSAYDKMRPSLVRRFAQAYLYYSPAKDMAWSTRVSKDGKTFYAVASTADLMYVAEFWFAYTRAGDQWVPGKVFAREMFKGE